jgi:hypothetical protein
MQVAALRIFGVRAYEYFLGNIKNSGGEFDSIQIDTVN